MRSATIKAARLDCLSDILVTTLTLVSITLGSLTTWPIDAFCALIVTVLIIYSGGVSFWENVSLLLGNGLDLKTRKALSAIVDTYPQFSKIESIITNDFGPENLIVVLELVPTKRYQLEAIQTAADQLSARLSQEFDFKTIVYW